MRNILFHRSVLWLLLPVLVFCQSCVVQKLDATPYTQTAYYQHTLAAIDSLPDQAAAGDTLQVGWAKVNMTPPAGTPLAGYGKRRGMRYTTVHDSAWARTFAFDNGKHKAYFVTLDMLIAPMSVVAVLEQEYAKHGLKPEQVYLAATHTHTGFGGWGRKIAGRIMAGKYSKQLVNQTAHYILQSIHLAQANTAPAKIGFGTANGAAFVKNRLTGTTERDTTIRYLTFEQQQGKKAILCTFAAHPTILPSRQPILSGDYPQVLVQELEQQYDFAAFSAGAVGSHSSVYHHGDSFESTQEVGAGLAKTILESIPATGTAYTTKLASSRTPLYLPSPSWRLGEHRRFAPALFHTFFGKYNASIHVLQVGNITMLGVPADYSGEFMAELETTAVEAGKRVVVTGFNGSYLGYIIPDRHYMLKKYEARAMNFYGPTAGSYITHVLQLLLKR